MPTHCPILSDIMLSENSPAQNFLINILLLADIWIRGILQKALMMMEPALYMQLKCCARSKQLATNRNIQFVLYYLQMKKIVVMVEQNMRPKQKQKMKNI